MPDMDLRILVSARDATRGVLGSLSSALGGLAPVAAGAGLAVAGVGLALGYSVKQAADFQQGLNRLKTGAGDTTDNLTQLGQGILKVSTSTGVLTSGTDGLNAAMYQIISSGQRGAEALDALNVSAKGSIIEQANVVDVAKAVATAMTDYGTTTFNATQYMNGYIYAVAHGRITLEELAQTMGPILPYAKNLGIAFSDVAGAMSTMTNAGIPAARAATSLRFLFQSLENPTKKALTAMRDFGVNSIALGDELRVSLPGALEMVYNAAKKAGPEGSVPFNRAISDMIGGMRSMQAYLSLTGSHFHEFQLQAGNVAAAMKAGSKEVQGWSTVQGNLNMQLDRAHAALDAMAINLGTQLLPLLTPLASKFADWLGSLKNVDFSGLVSTIQGLGTQLGNAWAWMQQIGGWMANSQAWKDTATNIGAASQELGNFLNEVQKMGAAQNGQGGFVQNVVEGAGQVGSAVSDIVDHVTTLFADLGKAVNGTQYTMSTVQEAVFQLNGTIDKGALSVKDATDLMKLGYISVKDNITGATIVLKDFIANNGKMPQQVTLMTQMYQKWLDTLKAGTLISYGDFIAKQFAKVEAALKVTGATADQTRKKLLALNGPYKPDIKNDSVVKTGEAADLTRRKLLDMNGPYYPQVNTSSITGATQAAQALQWNLQRLNGSSVWTSYINTVNQGGPVVGHGFASGTQNFPGGVGLVGERGPELVSLPAGSRIYNNSQTRSMMRGGGPTFNITVNTMAGSRSEVQRMVDLLEQEIASRFRGQTPNFGFGGLV